MCELATFQIDAQLHLVLQLYLASVTTDRSEVTGQVPVTVLTPILLSLLNFFQENMKDCKVMENTDLLCQYRDNVVACLQHTSAPAAALKLPPLDVAPNLVCDLESDPCRSMHLHADALFFFYLGGKTAFLSASASISPLPCPAHENAHENVFFLDNCTL